MGFSDRPCYWPLGRTNWASVLGQCQGLGHLTGLTFSLDLASGLVRLFFKPYQDACCILYFRFLNFKIRKQKLYIYIGMINIID